MPEPSQLKGQEWQTEPSKEEDKLRASGGLMAGLVSGNPLRVTQGQGALGQVIIPGLELQG